MGSIAEVPKEFISLLRQGDNRCEFKIGQRVMKMDSLLGDLHAPGKQGVVAGNIFMEKENTECYLILFDGDPKETFIIKSKLIGL